MSTIPRQTSRLHIPRLVRKHTWPRSKFRFLEHVLYIRNFIAISNILYLCPCHHYLIAITRLPTILSSKGLHPYERVLRRVLWHSSFLGLCAIYAAFSVDTVSPKTYSGTDRADIQDVWVHPVRFANMRSLLDFHEPTMRLPLGSPELPPPPGLPDTDCTAIHMPYV